MRVYFMVLSAVVTLVAGCAREPVATTPSAQVSTAPTTSPTQPRWGATSESTHAAPSSAQRQPSGSVVGMDVSAFQPSVDWAHWRATGMTFVWIKVTEGTTWTNQYYRRQRQGARAVGLYQGAYHYARPASSVGAAQARHFVAHGGAWSADGHTLPGALDLEKNPNGAACYGLTPAQMVAWITDFATTYDALTGRSVVIYVRADWWNECTGRSAAFARHSLWLYDHDGTMGPMPAGWRAPTLWQYATTAAMDRNRYLGSEAELTAWAKGTG